MLNAYEVPLGLTEISLLADIKKSALEGMIDFLLRKGKINEILPETEYKYKKCTAGCGIKGCSILEKTMQHAERYFKASDTGS